MSLYEKVLMRRTIKDAHKDLNEERTRRYRQRQARAHELELNFRFLGVPLGHHGVKRDARYRGSTCYGCGHTAQYCTCKIEVRDQSGNISFLEA